MYGEVQVPQMLGVSLSQGTFETGVPGTVFIRSKNIAQQLKSGFLETDENSGDLTELRRNTWSVIKGNNDGYYLEKDWTGDECGWNN